MTAKNKGDTNGELKLFENLIASKTWLTTSEAAIYYGTTPAGIRNQVWRGQLEPYKRLGRLYFKRDDLDRQITSSRKKGE